MDDDAVVALMNAGTEGSMVARHRSRSEKCQVMGRAAQTAFGGGFPLHTCLFSNRFAEAFDGAGNFFVFAKPGFHILLCRVRKVPGTGILGSLHYGTLKFLPLYGASHGKEHGQGEAERKAFPLQEKYL
jgi:hypothetical protein